MSKTIILVQVTNRLKDAPTVQKVLTEHGCNIKTRLGLHDVADNVCSGAGLLILETIGAAKEIEAFFGKLKKIRGIKTKKVTF
jgi:hypothetical protein